MLGLGYNNWKLAIGNFVIIFGVQVGIGLLDLMATPEVWPTPWWVCKTLLTSVVATALFYGYNSLTKKTAA